MEEKITREEYLGSKEKRETLLRRRNIEDLYLLDELEKQVNPTYLPL